MTWDKFVGELATATDNKNLSEGSCSSSFLPRAFWDPLPQPLPREVNTNSKSKDIGISMSITNLPIVKYVSVMRMAWPSAALARAQTSAQLMLSRSLEPLDVDVEL